MNFKAILKTVMCLCLLVSFSVLAGNGKQDANVKELSGISIIGNKESPKSLYIVPWENSEAGVATSLSSGLLDTNNQALDKDVFLRELDFYNLSQKFSSQK